MKSGNAYSDMSCMSGINVTCVDTSPTELGLRTEVCVTRFKTIGQLLDVA